MVIRISGAFLCLTEELHAEEGAGGQYILGAYSSIVDITPNTPGFAMGSDFYFYTGAAGGNRTLPFGGLLAANLNASVYFLDVSIAYTLRPTILGAHNTAAIAFSKADLIAQQPEFKSGT